MKKRTQKSSREYERKLISPEEAANLVKDNHYVHFGGSANTALIIDKYLAKRKNELKNVTIGTHIDIHYYEFLKADPEGETFRWVSGFLGRAVRSYSKKAGPFMYRPEPYHDAPRLTREDLKGKIDIAYIVTTPMDEHGYFNLSLTCSYMRAVAEAAKTVVVVVREDLPWVYGGYNECLHISEVDYVVEDNEFKTPALPAPQPSKEDEMIAENVIEAGLITDRSTIQLGIGGLPSSVMKLIREYGYKDLGVHTEMMNDGIMDLIDEGLVTNRYKKLDQNKTVFTFVLGSEKLYRYLDRNPAVATCPVDYTNDPFIIAQQPRMFSLNQAAQIDLTGQVNSEQMGSAGRLYQVSGTGGQLDFVMGCLFSRDRKGKSVLALYSTHKGNSRIVPILPEGSAVTVPRSMVQYVATEWGVVYLRGYSIRERTVALINIAHPDHRDWLIKEAKKLGLFPPKYTPPAGKPENVIVRRD